MPRTQFATRYDFRALGADPATRQEIFARAVEQAAYVDAHGMDALMVSEHHASDDCRRGKPLPAFLYRRCSITSTEGLRNPQQPEEPCDVERRLRSHGVKQRQAEDPDRQPSTQSSEHQQEYRDLSIEMVIDEAVFERSDAVGVEGNHRSRRERDPFVVGKGSRDGGAKQYGEAAKKRRDPRQSGRQPIEVPAVDSDELRD